MEEIVQLSKFVVWIIFALGSFTGVLISVIFTLISNERKRN